MNFGPVNFGQVTDRPQMESDAYEPTMQCAQGGSGGGPFMVSACSFSSFSFFHSVHWLHSVLLLAKVKNASGRIGISILKKGNI